jgi:hypothetical protein
VKTTRHESLRRGRASALGGCLLLLGAAHAHAEAPVSSSVADGPVANNPGASSPVAARPESQFRHALGFQVSAFPTMGFVYRQHFERDAWQLSLLPVVLDGGRYVFAAAGVQWQHEFARWSGQLGGVSLPSTALRWVAGGGVAIARDQAVPTIAVPTENCQTAACQALRGSHAPLTVLASATLGLGVEFPVARELGLALATDLVMTVLVDRQGFYGAYPLPQVSASYRW